MRPSTKLNRFFTDINNTNIIIIFFIKKCSYDYGFRFFATHTLYDQPHALIEKRVWYGAEKILQLGVAQPIHVTVARGQYKNIKPHLEIKTKLVAPIEKGQVLGKVIVKLADSSLAEVDLIALESIQEGSLMRKLSDYVMGYFE